MSDDAVIVSIAVIGRSLVKDHVSIIINDGSKRLFSKERAYSFIVEKNPNIASVVSSFLRDDLSFFIDIEQGTVEKLDIEEGLKLRDLRKTAHGILNPSLLKTIQEIKDQRKMLPLKGSSLKSVIPRIDRSYDNAMSSLAHLDGYEPRPASMRPEIEKKRKI